MISYIDLGFSAVVLDSIGLHTGVHPHGAGSHDLDRSDQKVPRVHLECEVWNEFEPEVPEESYFGKQLLWKTYSASVGTKYVQLLRFGVCTRTVLSIGVCRVDIVQTAFPNTSRIRVYFLRFRVEILSRTSIYFGWIPQKPFRRLDPHHQGRWWGGWRGRNCWRGSQFCSQTMLMSNGAFFCLWSRNHLSFHLIPNTLYSGTKTWNIFWILTNTKRGAQNSKSECLWHLLYCMLVLSYAYCRCRVWDEVLFFVRFIMSERVCG